MVIVADRPNSAEPQRMTVREAVAQIKEALRDCANGDGGNELERRYSEARGRLRLETDLMKMFPTYLTNYASASTLVHALTTGPDHPLSAVEDFIDTLEDTLGRIERRGVNVDETGASPRVVEAVGTAHGQGTAAAIGEAVIPAAGWTGMATRTQRLLSLRSELEVAHSAVGHLIADLAEDVRDNGGPALDEHEEALEALRSLYRALGDLLQSIDRGSLNDELGDELAADIVRFGGRAADALRGDRAKYTLAVTAFAILSACGAGDWAGFVGGAILQVPKNKAGESGGKRD